MKPKIKLAFLSGTDELNRRLIVELRALLPELPLWVVSDFPPDDPSLKWIRYRVERSFAENLRYCREELQGHSIRLAGVMLVPNVPFRRMRLLALRLSPRGFLAFNENLNHFMLRPSSLPTIARHVACARHAKPIGRSCGNMRRECWPATCVRGARGRRRWRRGPPSPASRW